MKQEVYNELYHYGVKGMKWGVRNKRELKVAKRFARVGRNQGAADYWRKKGTDEYKKYDRDARAIEKTAKTWEALGMYTYADTMRKNAAAKRAKGLEIREESYQRADSYMKKAQKLNEKASSYATKKRVNLGKKTLDNILSESKQKGRDTEKYFDDINSSISDPFKDDD